MPDILNLIIWLVAGVAGGNAAGELLKGDYDLGAGTRPLEQWAAASTHHLANNSCRQWGRSDCYRRRYKETATLSRMVFLANQNCRLTLACNFYHSQKVAA